MIFSRRFPQPRPVRAQPTFTFIDDVAIPLALCVMEAQPIAMVLAFLTLIGGSPLARTPLGIGEVVLLLLGLLWWAIALAHWQARGRLRSAHVLAALRLCSLLAVWLVLSIPHFLVLGNAAEDVVLFGKFLLALWLWRRSLARARLGFTYEPLATSFKVGLGVLLGVMLLALVAQPALVLLPQLQASLTIFFLSGLVTLSLARLGVLRQVRTVNGRQADPTRAWVGALTLFSCALMVLVFLFEALFSYTSFLWIFTALRPVWDALGTAVGWLLSLFILVVLAPLFALFSWLIGLVRGNGKSQPANPPPPSGPFAHLTNMQHPAQLPPELLSIGRWVALGGAAIVLVLLVRANVQRWFLPSDAEQLEETRERLDRQTLRNTRPQKRRTGRRTVGSSLTPESARAYYRLLLHAVATAQPDLAHQPDETPLEYEQRLRARMQVLFQEQEHAQPTGEAILSELTQGYLAERYGQQQLDPQRRFYLHQWMPQLLKTLDSRASAVEKSTAFNGRRRKGRTP